MGVAISAEDEVGLGLDDLRDLGRPVVTVERYVLLSDDLDAELGRIELDDRVGGAREHVVGSGEEERLDALRCQVVHRGDDLLVRRGTRVVDVGRRLETFVLDRVEEQPVMLFDDGLDRLAR